MEERAETAQQQELAKISHLKQVRDIEGLSALTNSSNQAIKIEVIKALIAIREKPCVPALVSFIEDIGYKSKDEIRLMGNVAYALGEIGDKRAVPALKNLQKIKMGSGIGGGSFDDMMKKAAELQQTVEWVKEQAAEALIKIG